MRVFVIVIISILVFFLISLVIFSWKNAKASIKPKILTNEQEREFNKQRGLWLDFDSYDTKKYEIEGKDGYILHAEFVDTKDTRGTGKYMILCHGHTSTRYGSVKYLNSYIKLGFSCLIYDARTHGENAPDKCTLGNVESEDLLNVIEDTRNRYPDINVLGLHGESMGSVAALIVTKYNPDIDFIVSDCANVGTYEVIYDCYKNIHLQFLTPLVWLAGKIIYGVDIKDTDTLRDMTGKYPILFIHGANDTFIKPYHSKKLYEKASKNGAYTKLILVEGAGHAKSRKVAGFETYTGYIRDFLKEIGIVCP